MSQSCSSQVVEALRRNVNSVVKVFTVLTAALISFSSHVGVVHAAQQARENASSWFTTPFGIIYRKHARETVPYPAKHAPGTIVVNTKERYLYFVLGEGQALRYTIGVGKEGHAWAGTNMISAKREWPDWSPTPNIKKRDPSLPNYMKGGETNPLGARALYLGSTMYRIHGTNEPWKIGDAVSSGCIRLINEDVIDLYDRAKIGATVIVQR
jgi:lipoprotein-anchoring transpeptidase ErfK/SrfK